MVLQPLNRKLPEGLCLPSVEAQTNGPNVPSVS